MPYTYICTCTPGSNSSSSPPIPDASSFHRNTEEERDEIHRRQEEEEEEEEEEQNSIARLDCFMKEKNYTGFMMNCLFLKAKEIHSGGVWSAYACLA